MPITLALKTAVLPKNIYETLLLYFLCSVDEDTFLSRMQKDM